MTIIGVSLDSDKRAAIRAAKAESLEYAHAFDGLKWKNEVAVLYRVRGIPQTFLLDKELNIIAKGLRGTRLEKRMQQLLGEGDVQAAAAARRAPAKSPEKK